MNLADYEDAFRAIDGVRFIGSPINRDTRHDGVMVLSCSPYTLPRSPKRFGIEVSTQGGGAPEARLTVNIPDVVMAPWRFLAQMLHDRSPTIQAYKAAIFRLGLARPVAGAPPIPSGFVKEYAEVWELVACGCPGHLGFSSTCPACRERRESEVRVHLVEKGITHG